MLVLGEPFLRRGYSQPRILEARVERAQPIRFFREVAACLVGRRVQPLQRDEAFKIGVHWFVGQKKGPARRSLDFNIC